MKNGWNLFVPPATSQIVAHYSKLVCFFSWIDWRDMIDPTIILPVVKNYYFALPYAVFYSYLNKFIDDPQSFDKIWLPRVVTCLIQIQV